MKIGIWSDSVNFPSVPLMKISAYHKGLGDEVSFIEDGGSYDKAYISKIFNLPLLHKIPNSPPAFYADEISKGGTGFAIELRDGREFFNKDKHCNLPDEMERMYPDYELYPQFSEAYGFLTRGCCNNCGFCIVTPKEGNCSKVVAELNDFWRGQSSIKLLDPNILACKDREHLLEQLIETKAYIDFTQGLDARFMTDDVAKMLFRMRVKAIHFAFDYMKNEQAIIKGLQCFNRSYEKSKWNVKCYVLTNYDTTNAEDWYRVCKIRENGIMPDIRIYQKGTQNHFLTDLQRWCNNPRLFKSTEFSEYIPRADGKKCAELYPEILGKGEFFMATKAAEAAPKTDATNLNVYQKLIHARLIFQQRGVKKTGKNPSLEFMYFELEDIVPVATEIFNEIGLIGICSFSETEATLTIFNCDKPEESIVFSSPMRFMESNRGTNPVQALGASHTYLRRYLYMNALDVCEKDEIEPTITGDDEPPKSAKSGKKKPATAEERKEIKEELTGADEPANELQVNGLKAALSALLDKDPDQEEFVQSVAVKTNAFTEITKSQCEALIEGINNMLAQYGEG